MEAESLFNDATAAVAFTIVLVFAAGQSMGVGGAMKSLAIVVIGSLACGAVVAGIVLLLAGGTDDHLVEITFTTVAAFGSFLLAEHFHLSGVLATLTTGLMIGNIGHMSLSAKSREAVAEFWDYAAFVANSLIFLLIGIRIAHRDSCFRIVAGISCDRRCDCRARVGDLSALVAVYSFVAAHLSAPSTHSILGRTARRAGISFGAGLAG